MKKTNAMKTIIIVILILVIVAVIVAITLRENKTQENTTINNTSAENNTINSEETNEEYVQEPSIVPESQEPEEGEIATESEKTALDLAKEYRGLDDDSVYYTIDSENENNIIVVARDKETTEAVMYYEVNTETKEVKEQ